MSPTVFRARGFRFFFFSREESRIHIHVEHPEGEAKFWMTPRIQLAYSRGLNTGQIHEAQGLIEENEIEIHQAWQRHFQRRSD
jgi:hypothetical protein